MSEKKESRSETADLIHLSITTKDGKIIIFETIEDFIFYLNKKEKQEPAKLFYIATNRQSEVYRHLPHCEKICDFNYFCNNFLGKLNPVKTHFDFLGLSGLLLNAQTEQMLQNL